MQIKELGEGRMFVAENAKEVELMQKFSAALADYEMDKTPKVQRTKLQSLWLKVEYVSGCTLPASMGIRRTDVFECTDND